MELKGRLKLIAEKVPECCTACDIGTDHAYIPIYLALNGICKRAVASDVRQGPVNSAKENIEKFGLGTIIEARLGNGLETISEDEADVIIIAGMGGELIRNILIDGFDKARNAFSMVLQPMNSHEILREWLYENGFDIYDEEMVNEGKKIYTVISARWTGNRVRMDEICLYVGKKLFEKKDPLLKPYLAKKLLQLDKAINELQKAEKSGSGVFERYSRMRDKLKEVINKLD